MPYRGCVRTGSKKRTDLLVFGESFGIGFLAFKISGRPLASITDRGFYIFSFGCGV